MILSDERNLIKFIEPPDVRAIMYLTWSYEDIERGDDMWVFLPAESSVRRISAQLSPLGFELIMTSTS